MALSTENTLAIQALYARYYQALDLERLDDLLACFTPDGVFSAEQLGDLSVKGELGDYLTELAKSFKGRHWHNNLVIEEHNGNVTASCYVQIWNLGEQPASLYGTGIYYDELTETGDGWRFARRRLEMD